MVSTATREKRRLKETLEPLIAAEIDNYERETRAFLRGAGLGDGFRPFRLLHGIYGQRQDNAQMVRVKIPHGSLTAEQMDVLGDVCERFAPRRLGHVTTRQDVQFHFVSLADTPALMRMLARVGLTTREAAGNTVRNVTADHVSGLCADTVFDVTPHAEATARFFLRNPAFQKLPRKFKIAFSACPHDHGLVPIHDLGATAVLRNGRHGFRVTVGGGLGAAPRIADVLEEFVPADELLRVIEATLRVFDRCGQRRNRNKARIKFMVKRLGIEEVQRLVRRELAILPPAESGAYREPDWSFLEEEASRPSAAALDRNGHAPKPDLKAFERWKRTNAVAQAQRSFFMVYVLLPLGDLNVEQFHALAEMSRKYSGGRIRTAVSQDLVLRWVHEEDLPLLHADLIEAGLAEGGALTLSDVMSCPGTATCALGVTSSKGLGRAIREALSASNGRFGDDPLVERIRIKISGCPDSCGQHHVADIGFSGCAVHSGRRLVPAYSLLVAGRGDGPDARIGQFVLKVPAKRVPEAVVSLIDSYRQERAESELFAEWALRVGVDHVRELLAEYEGLPVFKQDPMAFVDWDASKLFSLEDRGEGECSV